MALAAGTVFEVNASATASNVNGGGFNPNNANMLTDGAATSATGSSPVFTSASYSFVANDVGHWVYIKSGTNWAPGWYQVASVAGGAATLTAAIGTAVQVSSSNLNLYIPSTVSGCATTASPTAATWTMDYSQKTSAGFTATDLTGTTTSCTSATNPFGPQMVGNLINLNSGTGVTAGLYEIVSVSGVTATLDRTAGASYSVVTYHTGGAFSFGAASDGTISALGALGTATLSTHWFIKAGTYNYGAALAFIGSASTNRTYIEGYNALRGDQPTLASGNQPVLNGAANQMSVGAYTVINNITLTGTATNLLNASAVAGVTVNTCKLVNTSTTAGRAAVNFAAGGAAINSDICSYRGNAISTTAAGGFLMDGCYVHDSNNGYNISSATFVYITNSIFAGNITAAVTNAPNTALVYILNNTFYGSENKLGIGYSAASNLNQVVAIGNIFHGFATAYAQTTGAASSAILLNNDFFNNTSEVTSAANVQKGVNNLALNPTFTSMQQVTFTNGTTSGSVLTSSGADFSNVVDGKDFLYLVSGTGVTAGVYGITSHTTTTLTLDIAPGTNATADKIGQVTTGRNWAIGTNLKAMGMPGVFPDTATTGYMDIGAAQRQETGSVSGGSFTFS